MAESGLSQQVVLQRLSVSPATLRAWLREYGTAVYSQMRRKLFTPTQKHQIVRELLDGRLSDDEALLKYGLRLKSTLREWVAAYQAAQPAAPRIADPPTAAGEAAALAAQLRQAQ